LAAAQGLQPPPTSARATRRADYPRCQLSPFRPAR
jgi:hypothetical protein